MTDRERDRERQRERDRERDRETERDRERQRETERDRERQTETDRDRERDRERERERNHAFFVNFNIIISHVFPESLIEIPQIVQKTRRFSTSILTIFSNFREFLTFPSCKNTHDIIM